MKSRLEQLEAFAKEDPTDAFTQYALALEYLKSDTARARAVFDSLLQSHPDYLPTYYPAAHLMIELGEWDRAENLFLKGLRLSQSLGDQKTSRELEASFKQWQAERES